MALKNMFKFLKIRNSKPIHPEVSAFEFGELILNCRAEISDEFVGQTYNQSPGGHGRTRIETERIWQSALQDLGNHLKTNQASGFAAWRSTVELHGPKNAARPKPRPEDLRREYDILDQVIRSHIPVTARLADSANELYGSFLRSALSHATEILIRASTEDSFDQIHEWTIQVIDRLPEPLFLLNRETQKVWFSNRAAKAILGLAREDEREFTSRTGRLSVSTPDGRPLDDKDLPSTRALRGETISGEEFRIRSTTGEYYVRVAAEPLPASNGQPASTILLLQDISALKTTEADLLDQNLKLTETERLLSTATQIAKVGFFDWDIKRDRVQVSDEFERIWGIGRSARLEDFLRLIDPEDRPKVEKLIAHSQATGETYHAQYRIHRNPDGEIRWIEAQGRVINGLDGEAESFFGTAVDITERKTIETETMAMVNSIPQLAWMGDDSGFLFWYNQGWQDFTGASQDEMKALGWAHFHHPDHLGRVTQKWRDTLRSGQPWEDTFPLRAKNGEYRIFLSRAQPVRDLSGKITKWFGTNTDVTDSVHAKEKLEDFRRETIRLNQILNATVEAAGIGFWKLNLKTSELAWDDQVLAHFGIERAHFDNTLESFFKYIHPDDISQVNEAVNSTIQTGRPYRIEYRAQHPDGTIHWIEARGGMTRDHAGTAFFSGSTMDITPRKVAELRLNTERAQLDQIFKQSPAAMAVWIGNDLVFDRVNSHYQRIFVDRQLTGLALLDACPELKGQGFDDLLRDVMHTKNAFEGVEVPAQIASSQGGPPQTRYFNFSYIPMLDEEGRAFGVYDHAVDVTETVNARNALTEAREAAEQANRAKSQFLANMSHEIRTPLGAIMGFSDLLRQPGLMPKEMLDYVTVIERNSKHLLRIVDDILDLSKVEAGMLVVEEIRFSLLEILSDFSSFMGLKARGIGVQFEVRYETKIPDPVLSDPTRLRQILNNIVSNSLKFTKKGRIQLFVSYTVDHLQFRVSDTGIGMTREQAESLFVPFRQADSSTTRKYGGTGLGLALTRRLCEAMGGSFDLESSRVGVGSTFNAKIKIKLPVDFVFVEPKNSELQPTNVPSAISRGAALEDLKILLIEDSPDNQILLNLMLSKQGAEIVIANDGHEGVQLALGKQFDLVLCDMQMPRMDGYETVRHLRGRGYNVPIVALTAHAMKEEYAKAMNAGFSDYLTKPVQKAELIATILNHVRHSNS